MNATIQLKPTDGTEPFKYNCEWEDLIEANGRDMKAHDLRVGDQMVAKGKVCEVKRIMWRN